MPLNARWQACRGRNEMLQRHTGASHIRMLKHGQRRHTSVSSCLPRRQRRAGCVDTTAHSLDQPQR